MREIKDGVTLCFIDKATPVSGLNLIEVISSLVNFAVPESSPRGVRSGFVCFPFLKPVARLSGRVCDPLRNPLAIIPGRTLL